jgi:hypothetical protein
MFSLGVTGHKWTAGSSATVKSQKKINPKRTTENTHHAPSLLRQTSLTAAMRTKRTTEKIHHAPSVLRQTSLAAAMMTKNQPDCWR